jgi:hypothetical protein
MPPSPHDRTTPPPSQLGGGKATRNAIVEKNNVSNSSETVVSCSVDRGATVVVFTSNSPRAVSVSRRRGSPLPGNASVTSRVLHSRPCNHQPQSHSLVSCTWRGVCVVVFFLITGFYWMLDEKNHETTATRAKEMLVASVCKHPKKCSFSIVRLSNSPRRRRSFGRPR